MPYSILSRITIGFCPCSELASLSCCVTLPVLAAGTTEAEAGCICIFMYVLGTATWKTKSVSGEGPEWEYVMETLVTEGLPASLLATKCTRSPFFSNATNSAGPPAVGCIIIGAPPVIPPMPIIPPMPPITSIALCCGCCGCAMGGASPPSKSISRSATPPPPAGADGSCMPPIPIGWGTGGAPPPFPMSIPPRMSASRSASAGLATAARGAAARGVPFDWGACFAKGSIGLVFFSISGMRSNTPTRIESHWKRAEYSTARCCSSSAIELRKGAINSRTLL
mmetsp:Transcript_17250/g.44183  ORF Transcript_17250/g.44183 Transcript_17250/m.44183 type:complete len:281 (-) Transcript_17250:1662-2504(-)